jgi:hypothetical protein
MMIQRESEKTVRLCCNKKNCPTVTDIGDGMVEIADDYGNIIKVKKEQASLISDGVKILAGEQIILG